MGKKESNPASPIIKENENMSIALGEIVADRITGFKGTAIARCEYLNGCIQYEVRPKGLDKEGKIKESVWIDEQQLTDEFKATRGGPANHPPLMSTPK